LSYAASGQDVGGVARVVRYGVIGLERADDPAGQFEILTRSFEHPPEPKDLAPQRGLYVLYSMFEFHEALGTHAARIARKTKRD